MDCAKVEESALNKITTNHTNPIKMFEEWYKNYLDSNPEEPMFTAGCLSTASKNGNVTSRNLLLKRLDEDGFVMMTDNRSYKFKVITENPQVSLVFLWNQFMPEGLLSRQVRIYGFVKKLANEETEKLYEDDPIFAKIRSYICESGKPEEWDSLKAQHDELLRKIENNEIELKKPDHIVSFKIFPQYMDFYETCGKRIADRLLYTKSDSTWKISRLAA
ncbi:hypothetical protein PGB90_005936 [Kerria lacca]